MKDEYKENKRIYLPAVRLGGLWQAGYTHITFMADKNGQENFGKAVFAIDFAKAKESNFTNALF
ncbi:MAG: hypothetical protein Q8K98_00220 [Bacteroidota bacterium]|nr:hypothetical protein [Bacteroidota bacterium]